MINYWIRATFGFRDKLTPVYKLDNDSGGYSIYFKEHPNVVSQGSNKKQALQNLEEDLKMALEMQKRGNSHQKSIMV